MNREERPCDGWEGGREATVSYARDRIGREDEDKPGGREVTGQRQEGLILKRKEHVIGR